MLLEKKKLSKILLYNNQTVNDVISALNKTGLKIVCVVDEKNFFTGIITDGDIRRALLKKINLSTKINVITNSRPIIYEGKFDLKKIEENSLNKNLDHLPIIKNKKIIAVYINKKNDIEKKFKKKNFFLVIMAGGRGTRLKPLTNKVPKALLKFKNKPLIEHIIDSAIKKGILNFIVSVFYKKKMIINYLKSKNLPGLNISYIKEKKPLGTIGSIKYIKNIKKSFFVFNCDSLVDINLDELMKYHLEKKSILTIVIKNYKYNNPYGVIKYSNYKFISFEEKPSINFNINCGIYVFKPVVIKVIRKFKINNIIDLINILTKNNFKISVFPIYEQWSDFGQNKGDLTL